MRLQDYLIPYIISNVVSVLLIFICYKWPKIGKIVWGLFFFSAGIFNIYTAIRTPHVYAEVYGQTAIFSFYKNFIYGIFNELATLFVTLIGSGQIVVAILLFMRKSLFNLGILGGMIFLIAISPLGIGSAFPATLIMATSLFVLYKKVSITIVMIW